MVTAPTKYPFFNLIGDNQQAEIALSVLTAFGSEKEKRILLPEAQKMQMDFMKSEGRSCLVTGINNLLTAYLEMYGEFSDDLTIFLSKSLIEQKLADAT
jgi:hypothetical protein